VTQTVPLPVLDEVDIEADVPCEWAADVVCPNAATWRIKFICPVEGNPSAMLFCRQHKCRIVFQHGKSLLVRCAHHGCPVKITSVEKI
jgi:hypothetical protein